MLVMRLQRTGRKGHAMFRLVVQDSRRTPTSGKVVARLGSYDPHAKVTAVDKEKAQFYLDHGAQPSGRVIVILQKEGVKLPDWVEVAAQKNRKTRNADKRRSTRPVEPEAEAPAAEPEAETAPEVEETQASPEPANETTEKTEDTEEKTEVESKDSPVAEEKPEPEANESSEAEEALEEPKTDEEKAPDEPES
jgi:small subunit ribosomal protein S16